MEKSDYNPYGFLKSRCGHHVRALARHAKNEKDTKFKGYFLLVADTWHYLGGDVNTGEAVLSENAKPAGHPAAGMTWHARQVIHP